jgi:molybdopterin-guanine dinucleotide biosynthesis protein A
MNTSPSQWPAQSGLREVAIAKDSMTGLVLAGGQASRMQIPGQDTVDKGLLQVRGMPLVALAQRYLEPKVGRLCISANRNLDTYGQYGRVISDDPVFGESSGPLAGIASALAQSATPWLMVIPVDVPDLPEELVQRLAEAVSAAQAQIAYAATNVRSHPLCMLMHRDLLAGLREFLLAGGRKVQVWQKENHALEVQFPDAEHRFFNVNTPQDWGQVLQSRNL